MKHTLFAFTSLLVVSLTSCFSQGSNSPYDTSAVFIFDLTTPELDSSLQNSYHYKMDEENRRTETLEFSALSGTPGRDTLSRALHFPNEKGRDTFYIKREKIAGTWHVSTVVNNQFHPTGELKNSKVTRYQTQVPYSMINESYVLADTSGNEIRFQLEDKGSGLDTTSKLSMVLQNHTETLDISYWDEATLQLRPQARYKTILNDDQNPVSEISWISDQFTLLAKYDSSKYEYDEQARPVSSNQFLWEENLKTWLPQYKTLRNYFTASDTLQIISDYLWQNGQWDIFQKRFELEYDSAGITTRSSKIYKWTGTQFSWYSTESSKTDEQGKQAERISIHNYSLDSTDIQQSKVTYTQFGTSNVLRTIIYWESNNYEPFQKWRAYYFSVPEELNLVIENKGIFQWKIYPNPAVDFFVIILPNSKPTLLELYDISGNLIFGQPLTTTETQIPISNLSPGIYLAKISQGSTVEVKRLVVE